MTTPTARKKTPNATFTTTTTTTSSTTTTSNKRTTASSSSTSSSGRTQSMSTTATVQPPSGKDKSLSPAAAVAQYHKQQKYGIYHTPGVPVVGVSTDSSGSAAVLAAKSDLSLKLWKHETSGTGKTAAVLASTTSVSPEIWKPDSSASAASAALIAKDKKILPTPEEEAIANHSEEKARNASLAALSAHSIPANQRAREALPDAYAWSENNAAKQATNIVRSASIHVYQRQALKSDGSVKSDESNMDDQIAAANSASSPSRRRSRAASVTSDKSQGVMNMNLGGIEEIARQRASERLNTLYGGPPPNLQSINPSAAAAASNSTSAAQNELNRVNSQNANRGITQEAIRQAVLQHESLMRVARENADRSLAQVQKQVNEKNLWNNPTYNAAALSIAESNSKDRLKNHGKIDIGGGKFMTQSEIEAIAQRNVEPTLKEISVKAQAQREADEERRQAEEAEKARVAEEKRVASEQKAEDKRIKREEKQKGKAEKDQKKAEEKAEKDQKKAEEKAKRKELKRQQAEQREKIRNEKAHLKAALDQQKHAEAVARTEVGKLTAMQEAAQARLDAARLEESAAETPDAAQAAGAAVAQREQELNDVSSRLDLAHKDHNAQVAATETAQKELDTTSGGAAVLAAGTTDVVGTTDDLVSPVSSYESALSSVEVPADEAASAPGITTGALEGPTASKLAVQTDNIGESVTSTQGLTDKVIEGPTASQLVLGETSENVESTTVQSKKHPTYTTGITDAAIDGPTVSQLTLGKSTERDISGADEIATKPTGLADEVIEGPSASKLAVHEPAESVSTSVYTEAEESTQDTEVAHSLEKGKGKAPHDYIDDDDEVGDEDDDDWDVDGEHDNGEVVKEVRQSPPLHGRDDDEVTTTGPALASIPAPVSASTAVPASSVQKPAISTTTNNTNTVAQTSPSASSPTSGDGKRSKLGGFIKRIRGLSVGKDSQPKAAGEIATGAAVSAASAKPSRLSDAPPRLPKITPLEKHPLTTASDNNNSSHSVAASAARAAAAAKAAIAPPSPPADDHHYANGNGNEVIALSKEAQRSFSGFSDSPVDVSELKSAPVQSVFKEEVSE